MQGHVFPWPQQPNQWKNWPGYAGYGPSPYFQLNQPIANQPISQHSLSFGNPSLEVKQYLDICPDNENKNKNRNLNYQVRTKRKQYTISIYYIIIIINKILSQANLKYKNDCTIII